MTTDRLMRVSDAERQAAAERLRVAMADGRLDLLEYDNRIAAAFRAVTYADLDQLFTDLPASNPVAPAPRVDRPPVLDGGTVADMHLALKILWTIWGGAVVINLTVWLLVSLGSGVQYFWPMWMAVPGVALLGATVGVESIRRGRAERRRRVH
jgi:Domain of unknown function (DUF1707)